jgi:hypothetical protein
VAQRARALGFFERVFDGSQPQGRRRGAGALEGGLSPLVCRQSQRKLSSAAHLLRHG